MRNDQQLPTNCLRGGIALALFLFLLSWSTVQVSRASMPLDPRSTVEQAVLEIVGILTDPELAVPEARYQRHRRVVAEIERFFDFNEISMRALGPRWRDLSPAQREQFIALFKKFLEKNYIDHVDDYTGEQVVVKDQEIREDRRGNQFAMVNTDFVTRNQQAVPVNYKLLNRGGNWMVYDIDIEGISLVRNFRTQFEPYSYDELIRRMEQQIATGKGFEPR